MAYKPPSRGTRSRKPSYNTGPPAWLVFLLGMAVVFGGYYVWLGVRDFVNSSGILELPTQTVVAQTATAAQIATQQNFTPPPTPTPLPTCQDFVISVEAAVVRSAPTTNSQPLDTWEQNEPVCVMQHQGEWYLIDLNPRTRRIDTAYIREDLVEAVNPTPTPSNTPTPAPTVTPLPTNTPTETFTPAPTSTPDPDASATPTQTPSASPTTPLQGI